MIPTLNTLINPIETIVYPTETYKINIEANRVAGYTDNRDALMQAIYLILSTERYKHIIYSWDYGIELLDLFGKPMPYVMAELKRRVSEALLYDDRITSVDNFVFDKNGKKLHVTFDVTTIYGVYSVEQDYNDFQNINTDGVIVRLDSNGTLRYNVPAFYSNDILLFNDPPILDENGILIFD